MGTQRISCGKVQKTGKGMGSSNKISGPEGYFRLSISENKLELDATKKVKLLAKAFERKEIDADFLCIEIKRLLKEISLKKIDILKGTANLLYSAGAYTHAAAIYIEILMIEPMNHDVYRMLGLIHQTNGSRNEARYAHKKSMFCANKVDNDYWDGIHKCKNLVITANGVGETILVSRQVGYLRRYSENIGIITRKPMKELAEMSKQFDFIIASNQPDQSAKLLIEKNPNSDTKITRYESIMAITKDPLFHPSHKEIMLFPDDHIYRYWKDLFNTDSRYKTQDLVGLCWNTKQISPMHPDRSFKLEDISILSTDKSILFASFQNGYGSDQLYTSTFKEKFVNSQDILSNKRDFPNTVASMKLCKYFITCDTGIAQVACSLGLNTVVIVNDKPSAPWAGDGERSYYYKNAFIYRKGRDQSWQEGITELFKYKTLAEIFGS